MKLCIFEHDTRAKIVNLAANGKKILQTALTKVENADVDFFPVGTKNLLTLT